MRWFIASIFAVLALNVCAECSPGLVHCAYKIRSWTTDDEFCDISGTATGIATRTLVTAFHVVENAKRCEVEINGAWKTAKIVRTDNEFDIALLAVDVDLSGIVSLDDRKDAQFGEATLAYGVPDLDKPVREFKGFVSRAKLPLPILTVYRVIDSEAILPGCSGGPVIGAAGKLIGIMIFATKANDFGVFLPARRIKQFLAEDREK